MLTLTRKAGQKIRIGDDIEIIVREIRGKQVRLGIIAPNGLTVYREELYQQILLEGPRPEPDPNDGAPSDEGLRDEGSSEDAPGSADREHPSAIVDEASS